MGCSADHVALDHRDLRAEPGGVRGRRVAGRAATDDHEAQHPFRLGDTSCHAWMADEHAVDRALGRGRRHVTLRYGVDEMRFTTTYWYDDVDFDGLEQRYGPAMMRAVEFHLLAFEANKAGSLAPTAIDPGPYADLFTEAFWELWSTIFHHVWGVWRYENGRPEYRLPRPSLDAAASDIHPVPVGDGPFGSSSCVVAARTASSACGCSNAPASRTTRSSTATRSTGRPHSSTTLHRGARGAMLATAPSPWVGPRRRDDAPLSAVYPELGIERVVAAETVSSYWTALPVALQHGCTEVALGVTRSTDEHNLVWELTGERINYLWGMSSAAEQLLHDYVRTNLFTNLRMFHLLRPVYDLNVFSSAALASSTPCRPPTLCAPEAVVRTLRQVHLRVDALRGLAARRDGLPVLHVNLFDLPENRSMLRKMLGLEGYKPTDCVGTVSEARLAFAMCRAKGVGGVIADDIDAGGFVEEAPATLARYAAVEAPGPTFPPRLARELTDPLAGQAAITDAYARDVLALAPVP